MLESVSSRRNGQEKVGAGHGLSRIHGLYGTLAKATTYTSPILGGRLWADEGNATSLCILLLT